jgi:acyl-homoserine lactone synthase
MHIRLVDTSSRLEFSRHLVEMHHDRKRVFIDQLGWQLPTSGSWLEVDQFDTDYTVYLLACDQKDRHVASVRLNPTTRPHMLNTVFQGLCDGGPLVAPDVWESSRFTIAPIGLRGTEVMRLSQYLALAHTEFALLNGITRYTMIGEVNRFATVTAMGWKVKPLCLPTDCEGKKIIAMEVFIDEETLDSMRARFGIRHDVLSRRPHQTRTAA